MPTLIFIDYFMKLSFRTKIYGSIIVTATFAFSVLCLYLWFAEEKTLEELQVSDAKNRLATLSRLVENELEHQVKKQADWARWDDTYQFVTDKNDAFILSNMNDESLKLIEINMMAFVNNAGELVYGKQVYSGEPGVRSIPEEFSKMFTGESALLDFDELISDKKGILVTPDHLLLVTAQPITTSDGKGARRGTLIFARYIDDQYIDSLSQLSGLNVSFRPYGFTSQAGDAMLRRGVPLVTVKEELVEGSLLMDNIFGNPSLTLGVTYPGEIIEGGHTTVARTLGSLFPGFLVYLSLTLLCIEVFLVRRIERIRETVRQVNALHPGGAEKGDLEDFSYLATVMAGAIEKVRQSDELADVTWNEIAKFRVALDQSFDHMVITDVDGKILYANTAAEKLTGYSRIEMQGKTPALWGRQMPREFYEKFWDLIRREKKPFEGVVKNKRKDGTIYQAEVRVTPVLDDKKRILYFIGVERPAKPC